MEKHETEPRLFEVEVIEEVVQHPPQVMRLADSLHDLGRVEDADRLLDMSADFIALYDRLSAEVEMGVTGQHQH